MVKFENSISSFNKARKPSSGYTKISKSQEECKYSNVVFYPQAKKKDPNGKRTKNIVDIYARFKIV